jgi:hypothetical protein
MHLADIERMKFFSLLDANIKRKTIQKFNHYKWFFRLTNILNQADYLVIRSNS